MIAIKDPVMTSPIDSPKNAMTFKEIEELLDSLAAQKTVVESKLESLARKRQQLDDEHKALEKQYYDASLLKAQTQCRHFAKAFSKRLPLELRDLVYAQVWDDPHDIGKYFTPPDARSTYQGERSLHIKARQFPWDFHCSGPICSCFSWRNFSPWLHPSFVGKRVATEAAAAYYRVMPAEWSRSLATLPDYLLNDQFHLGVRPLDHIRRLYLTCDPYTVAPDSWTNRHEPEYLEKLSKALDILREIPNKSNFHLVIRMSRAWYETQPVLNALRDVVGALKHAGARVQVIVPFQPSNNRSVAFASAGNKHFDISDYYDMPLEEWERVWQNMSEEELAERKDVTAVEFNGTGAKAPRGRGRGDGVVAPPRPRPLPPFPVPSLNPFREILARAGGVG